MTKRKSLMTCRKPQSHVRTFPTRLYACANPANIFELDSIPIDCIRMDEPDTAHLFRTRHNETVHRPSTQGPVTWGKGAVCLPRPLLQGNPLWLRVIAPGFFHNHSPSFPFMNVPPHVAAFRHCPRVDAARYSLLEPVQKAGSRHDHPRSGHRRDITCGCHPACTGTIRR